jgi:hypothetical protein
MGRIKILTLSVISVGAALLLGGCGGSYQARSMDIKEGQTLFVNPSILVKGTGDQMLYRYENTKADIKKYTKVIIEPVIISKSAELDAGDLENYQKLANNAFVYLNQELSKDYQVVTSPDPQTLRVQMGITDADTSKPVRNFLSSFMPIGMGLSAVRYAATGKQSGVGEISGEFKLTDASTGELLAAAVDRRVGGKAMSGIWDTWYNADEALKYWAQRTRFALCEARGGANCVKPGEGK